MCGQQVDSRAIWFQGYISFLISTLKGTGHMIHERLKYQVTTLTYTMILKTIFKSNMTINERFSFYCFNITSW